MRKSSGFTLVELLVVLAVLSLVISIVLASITKTRREADLVACKANLRQIGICVHNYAARNSGQLFPLVGLNVPAGERWTNILLGLGPEDGGSSLCPTDRDSPIRHSYFLNGLLIDREVRLNTRFRYVKTTKVIVVGEKFSWISNYGYTVGAEAYIDSEHHGSKLGSNYLFLDGHVENTNRLPIRQGANHAWDPGP
jgi:prepilin-type N-terminal cleavage/methylation domain-containing protein/prepilin-type processing-associated H-X9-DG protein